MNPAGIVSVTTTLFAAPPVAAGELFVAVMLYVSAWPGAALATASVLVRVMLGVGGCVSTSVFPSWPSWMKPLWVVAHETIRHQPVVGFAIVSPTRVASVPPLFQTPSPEVVPSVPPLRPVAT